MKAAAAIPASAVPVGVRLRREAADVVPPRRATAVVP